MECKELITTSKENKPVETPDYKFRSNTMRLWDLLTKSKAMRREIEDEKAERIAAGKCPECQTELRNEAGCKHCPSCGWSACE